MEGAKVGSKLTNPWPGIILNLKGNDIILNSLDCKYQVFVKVAQEVFNWKMIMPSETFGKKLSSDYNESGDGDEQEKL